MGPPSEGTVLGTSEHDAAGGRIHEDHPFATPPELREPARRLRGRLVAPVTVVTSDGPDGPAGLTVASILVVDGDPARVVIMIGELTDLAVAIDHSGVFVVHVLDDAGRATSEVFAGFRPAPGGMFSGRRVTPTKWGPRLDGFDTWAGCRLEGSRSLGHHREVVGVIESISIEEETSPLVWYRGRYTGLA